MDELLTSWAASCYDGQMAQKILLVEDSMLDAKLITHALTQSGIGNQVVHATDGGVALWHLAVESNIAVVLLDLKLRVVGGLELLSTLRAHPEHRDLPVIILSGSVDPPDRNQAAQLGTSSFVLKNPDVKAFSESLREALAPFRAMLSA